MNMNSPDPYYLTYQAHCAACQWSGPSRLCANDADDDTLDHADTGQHTRNMERWSGMVDTAESVR